MASITNYTNVSLPLAVWLVSDGYDFHPTQGQKAVSATALLKPVRQILLKERLTPDVRDTPDVADFIPSRLGHAIHDSVERSWRDNYKNAMRTLGYPEDMIQRIKINPEEPGEDIIPVYLEQRGFRNCMGYQITGKFDQIIDGELHDFKSTSVYSWMSGDKDEDYSLQGSIYRWLNPEKITQDHMYIQFVFTDWQRAMAKQNPNYPQSRVLPHKIDLKSVDETDNWIRAKLKALEEAADLPEEQVPFCPEEALWKQPTVWKYYSNPAKTDGRASKNFDNEAEANAHMAEKRKGVVIEVPGVVKACSYCPAFNICTQKDLYEHG